MKQALAIVSLLVITLSLFLASSLAGNNDDLLVLSSKTTVSLNTPITEDSVKALQIELMDKSNKLGRSKNLVLTLNSPGGSMDAGLKLIETAKGLKQTVDTLSMYSASMSFLTSQYLGKRYVLDNSILMSHRAYVAGVEGNIPGSFITRTNHILAAMVDIDKVVASRSHMGLENYERTISNELWMRGRESVDMKFADKVVRVRCDASLQGPGRVNKLSVLGFTIKLTYHKCPLVTEPMEFELEGNTSMSAEAKHIWNLYLNDKAAFIEEYIVTGKFNAYIK